MHSLCAQRERACHILRYPRFTLCESHELLLLLDRRETRHDCAEKGTRGLSKLSIVSFHSRLGFTVGDGIIFFHSRGFCRPSLPIRSKQLILRKRSDLRIDEVSETYSYGSIIPSIDIAGINLTRLMLIKLF